MRRLTALWALLAVLVNVVVSTTTNASAGSFVYDAATTAQVDARGDGGGIAELMPVDVAREQSAPPLMEAPRTSTTQHSRSVATEAESAIPGLSASEQRAVNSLEQRVAEHQAKLEAYQADPFANDNLGILERAPSTEIQQSIIDGRIRHLQNEIQAFQDQIDKLLGGRS